MFWKWSLSDSESAGAIDWDDPHDLTKVLNAFQEDMMRLWHDLVIRLLLKAHKLWLEEMPGLWVLTAPCSLLSLVSLILFWLLICNACFFFTWTSFFNSLDRITTLDYVPTDGIYYSFSILHIRSHDVHFFLTRWRPTCSLEDPWRNRIPIYHKSRCI